MKRDIKKMIKTAEKLGWAVHIDEDGNDFTFRKYSPAGQDFNVSISADSLDEAVDKIKERCDNYDCSEEAYIWLDNSGHGSNGAPYDMKDVYEDMEACQEMLQELRDELKKINN